MTSHPAYIHQPAGAWRWSPAARPTPVLRAHVTCELPLRAWCNNLKVIACSPKSYSVSILLSNLVLISVKKTLDLIW